MTAPRYPFDTLPDLLQQSLDVVLIGINPSSYSVERGHYFARSTNRFWPAFSRSRLSSGARVALQRDVLGPEDDQLLMEFGIGFTDVVKTPSPNAALLRPADYALWSPQLLERLKLYQPRVACFQGVTGYRAFTRYALNAPNEPAPLGLQARRLGDIRIVVAPNPSPANAHYRVEDLTRCYDELQTLLE
ncbi:MAG: mismatch-specific DNA-glycosylase [Chloroflexota bacterium]